MCIRTCCLINHLKGCAKWDISAYTYLGIRKCLNRGPCELNECFLLVHTKYSYWYVLHAITEDSWKMHSPLFFASHFSNLTGPLCASPIYSCFLVTAVLVSVFGQSCKAVIVEQNKMLQPTGDDICISRCDVPPKMSLYPASISLIASMVLVS